MHCKINIGQYYKITNSQNSDKYFIFNPKIHVLCRVCQDVHTTIQLYSSLVEVTLILFEKLIRI
ncbi:hypothetical protein CI610_03387 [invertebrate metagenome]|uniref:Uncharacterized protein n=1 Tax=invertebrate metagenome TaxID=1711999 RepID=A0A2H9T383_9ZZZZ